LQRQEQELHQMILPNGTIVAVADGQSLALYRNKGTETQLDLVDMDEPKVEAGNAGSGGRHRNDSANPDGDRASEDAFAAGIADQLNRLALDGTVSKLFVIADPRTLGELRKHFHADLQGKLVGELAKNFAGRPLHEIAAAVQAA
jgi:protein required for attachment to host cells